MTTAKKVPTQAPITIPSGMTDSVEAAPLAAVGVPSGKGDDNDASGGEFVSGALGVGAVVNVGAEPDTDVSKAKALKVATSPVATVTADA